MEAVIAAGVMVTIFAGVAQLFTIAVRANISSQTTSYATVLARQKIEQLQSLTWSFDENGQPQTDTNADTTVVPQAANGGTGLSPSPALSLAQSLPGWVDYLDASGRPLGGGPAPPLNAVFARRWRVGALPGAPQDVLVIEVFVKRAHVSDAPVWKSGQPDTAYLAIARTRSGV